MHKNISTEQIINKTINSMRGAGTPDFLAPVMQDILQSNINAGASYKQMLEHVLKYITSNKQIDDELLQRAKQITTDALNQYTAHYSHEVSNDMEFNWYSYSGTLIETSRTLCKACKKKRYIHIVEIPDITKGDFKEFKELEGIINDETGLPLGMVPGTNAENFYIYRGGYNCGHQLSPTSEALIPKDVRIAVYDKYGIGYDENGYSIKELINLGNSIIESLDFANEIEITDRKTKNELWNRYYKMTRILIVIISAIVVAAMFATNNPIDFLKRALRIY